MHLNPFKYSLSHFLKRKIDVHVIIFFSQKLQKDMETFTVDNQKLMQEHKWVRWLEFVASLSKGKTDRQFKRWK